MRINYALLGLFGFNNQVLYLALRVVMQSFTFNRVQAQLTAIDLA